MKRLSLLLLIVLAVSLSMNLYAPPVSKPFAQELLDIDSYYPDWYDQPFADPTLVTYPDVGTVQFRYYIDPEFYLDSVEHAGLGYTLNAGMDAYGAFSVRVNVGDLRAYWGNPSWQGGDVLTVEIEQPSTGRIATVQRVLTAGGSPDAYYGINAITLVDAPTVVFDSRPPELDLITTTADLVTGFPDEGVYRANNWTADDNWQIAFSSVGVENLMVSSQLSRAFYFDEDVHFDDVMGPKFFQTFYSIDSGDSWVQHPVQEWELPMSEDWHNIEYDLPEECSDQNEVLVRWVFNNATGSTVTSYPAESWGQIQNVVVGGAAVPLSYPNVAYNPVPAHEAEGVLVSLEHVGWSYLPHVSYSDPIGFRVYINTSGDFGDDDPFEWVEYIDGEQDYTDSDILPDMLDYETTYYWKVVPTTTDPTRDDAVDVPVWSFTTEDQPFIPFAGGTGTEDDPYLVATAEQLNYVRDFMTSHFKQTANINLGVEPWNTGAGWQPIGTANNNFTGSYDGDLYAISNLFIARPTNPYQGLFGETEGSELKNIVINLANVTGQNRTGGLTGQSRSTNIDNCFVSGTVNGAWFVGGLTGYSLNQSSVTNSETIATVSGTQTVGGLLGYQFNSTTSGSKANGNVFNSGSYGGGLIGYNGNNGLVTQSFATGNVNGADNVGGLVGYNSNSSTISQSLASGAITSTGNYAGGLTGFMSNSVVEDSYANGDVSGASHIGGLIGYNSASTVNDSYSVGSVSGTGSLGGLIGSQFNSDVISSYWDTQASGVNNSAGGEGRTTVQMQQMATFVGWDFGATWAIFENESYPMLQWQLDGYLFPATNLTADVDDDGVFLSWTPPYTPEVSLNSSRNISQTRTGVRNVRDERLELLGYNIYRNNVAINTELVTDSDYLDTDVEFDINYTYYVTVVYDEGESGPSNSVSITLEPPYLYPPQNLSALAGNGSVELSWEAPEMPEDRATTQTRNFAARDQIEQRLEFLGYNVYRNDLNINDELLSVTEYVDTGVMNGITYSYHVTAVYAEGESEASNTVSATPEEPMLYPPFNLTYELDGYDVILEWEEPVDGEVVELVYDNNTNTGAYSYNGYSMATQMSPQEECQILTLKYYTTTTAGDNDFNAEIYNWTGTQPGTDLLYTENVLAANNQWLEVDVSSQNLFVTGDFVVGFGSINTTTNLAYDDNLNNNRSWDYNSATNSWSSWTEAYLIRAVVLYQDGTREEITPVVGVNARSASGEIGERLSVPAISPLTSSIRNNRELTLVGYNVYRDNVQINAETVTNTTYTDYELVPENTYTYHVTALYTEDDYEGESGPSNSVVVEVVSTDSNVAEPFTTKLSRNYPNPFNPTTTISFTTAHEGLVSLEVFNARGQKVITLVNDHLSAGEHKVVWNGRDNSNREVSSGIYFYRMESGTYSAIERMVLIK